MFRIGSLQRKIPRLAMPLSFKIGSAASPVSIDIGDSTQADVLTALENNSPFPMREIHLGNIAATLSTSSAAFVPAPGASVSLKASASFSSGLAVYQSPKQILSLLPLDPAISLDFQMSPNDRLMMLSFAATSSGSLNGTYPIGVVGSASVGLTGQLDDAFAVIHRFDKDVGAQDALRAVVDSLRGFVLRARSDELRAQLQKLNPTTDAAYDEQFRQLVEVDGELRRLKERSP